MIFKKLLIIILATLLVGCSSQNVTPIPTDNNPEPQKDPVEETTDVIVVPDPIDTSDDTPLSTPQINSIALLNYLTVVAEQIHQSPDGKMYLEEKYNTLINNLYPNAVDTETQSHVTDLLRSIEALRMISVKRDRLSYLYEQSKADALLSAVPSSEDILNINISKKGIKNASSLIHTVIDSATSYRATMNSIELDYLKDGWELDDSVSDEINEQRLNAWNYMQNIVRDNDLDGDLALNETAVNDLVSWEKMENITRRIALLEENEQKYKAYGGYWILLADSYYQDDNYIKCIEATDKYIATQPRIFRVDVSLANLLPCSISSIIEIRENNSLLDKEVMYVEKLVNNCNTGDWELRYFAGLTYLDLYEQTNKNAYLLNAYKLFRTNVNELIDKQLSANDVYLSDVKEVETSKSATKEQKDDIKQYNKMIKDVRKTELPPINKALLLNTLTLLSLAEKIGYSEDSKEVIDKLLHVNSKEALFLTETIDRSIWSSRQEDVSITASFDGKKFEIPAIYVCDNSKILVSVSGSSGNTVIDDWQISKVDRKKGNLKDFVATYTSKEIKDIKYQDGDKVVLAIQPYDNLFETNSVTFTVKEKKVALITTYEFVMD